MANNQIIISRIQNRRGLKENLPQPLLPGEIALTVDTGELWIGSDPNQPPYGVRTYSAGSGDISTAETIVDTQIAVAKFTSVLDQAQFDGLVEYLIDSPNPAVVLTEDDILWDNQSTIFIAAVGPPELPDNTINNILDAIIDASAPAATVALFDFERSGALGALNNPFVGLTGLPYNLVFADANPDTIHRDDGNSFVTAGFFVGQRLVVSGTVSNDGYYTIASFATTLGADDTIVLVGSDTLAAETISATASMLRGRSDPAITDAFDAVDGDFQFGALSVTSNSTQGANAATLINEINGAGIVTTFGNLQITTSGIGVGSPTFRDISVVTSDPFSGAGWTTPYTVSADSTTDELIFVPGTNINIELNNTDPLVDAIRISNTAEADPDKILTGFTQTPIGNDVQTEYVLTPQGSFTNFPGSPGFLIDMDAASDVIFVEYSLNIGAGGAAADNFTACGRMRIVGDANVGAGTATLVDDQTVLADGAGAVNFQAVFVGGAPNQIQVQYTNTFSSNVTMRMALRRWMSY